MWLRSVLLSTVVLLSSADSFPPTNGGGWTDISASVLPPTVAFPVRPTVLLNWNADQNVDMLVVGNDADHADVFSAWVWQDTNHSFAEAFTSPKLSNGTIDAIANAVAADFNRDGVNDIVILMRSGALWFCDGATAGSSGASAPAVQPLVLTGSLPSGSSGVDGSQPQLAVVNVFGSCALPDLVVTASNGDLYVLRNNVGNGVTACSYIGGPISFTPVLIDTHAVPLSITTADVDGGCDGRLIYGSMISNQQVTYHAFDSVQHTSRTLFAVPSFAGMPAVMDLNGDGVQDFVFPYCDATDSGCRNGTSDFSALLFVYSDVGGASSCSSDDCCVRFVSQFAANIDPGATSGDGFDVLSLSALGDGQRCPSNVAKRFPRRLATGSGLAAPLVIRSGDYNRDSQRDLAMTSNLGAMILTRSNGISLPPSYVCDVVVTATGPEGQNPVPFFFDIAEDGRVDLMMFYAQPTVSQGSGLAAQWNGAELSEEYFLTATIINGANPQDAGAAFPPPSWVSFPAYAATQVGAVHRFQWQDIDTNVLTAAFVQLGSSQGHALEIPRVHFGLGKTFSYVQNYAAGMHYTPATSAVGAASTAMHNTWPSYLIPNSQVYVIPYPLQDPLSWSIKLFLTASKFQTLLLISLGTALALLGLPIVLLKYRETREDANELKTFH